MPTLNLGHDKKIDNESQTSFAARAEVPWSQRLSCNIILFIILFYLQICDDRSADLRKRKPLVETVENLTFMLAQYLTAVKDVIFF